MGNPREISTRTCNGESAFLADGSDVDDDDEEEEEEEEEEEDGGRKIKGGREGENERERGAGSKEKESGGRRGRVKSFPWSGIVGRSGFPWSRAVTGPT